MLLFSRKQGCCLRIYCGLIDPSVDADQKDYHNETTCVKSKVLDEGTGRRQQQHIGGKQKDIALITKLLSAKLFDTEKNSST